MTFSTLLADNAQPAGGINPMMIVLLLLVAVMIFMMFRNKKKMAQQQEERKTLLVPGAEIMTTAGIFGTVVDVDTDNDRVIVNVSPGQNMTFHVRAVSQFVTKDEPASGASDEQGDANPETPRD